MTGDIRGPCGVCGHRASSLCPNCEKPVCSEHMLVAQWDLLEGLGDLADLLLDRIGGSEACTACLEVQLARRKPPYVAVHQDTDPDRVRELVKALELEGFDPRGVGLESAALFGEGQDLFAAWVEVPEAQKEGAKAALKRILAPAPAIEFTAELP